MSQIGSFTYLAATHVPMLGFWSKPKPRLFRSPESKFQDYLCEKKLRDFTFGAADGVYVALVFAWLQHSDSSFGKGVDPVIETVRRNVGGSHWLLLHDDRRWLNVISASPSDESLSVFLKNTGDASSWFERSNFDLARKYVADRIAEIAVNESLLVSVG
jgi:hypothetical protein